MGQENQTQKTIEFNTVGRKTRPKDHIWAKTTWDSTQCDKETRPKDDRIQHSWDRETRPKDHIWAKTIYGIQRSGTRKPDLKTIYGQRPYMGFNTVGTGKPDPKTIYGQRPYMGFNTVRTGKPEGKPDPKTMGQGSWTQRPYMGLKLDPKTIYGIQHSGTGNHQATGIKAISFSC